MLFLVVDDDALSRELLTLLLELEGYAVETAASGADALSRLAAAPNMPAVILADLQMPGIAGDALAQAMRNLLPPGTLLLAMSGSQPQPATLTAFDGFLLKPFKITELQSMISKIEAPPNGRKNPVPETSVAEKTGKIAPAEDSAEARVGILDEEIYEKLRDLMPGEQLGQMYALCLEDSRKRIAHMQALALAGDDAAFRAEAHAVKGGCGMIGATELYGLAETAERDGLALDPPVGSGARTAGTTPKSRSQTGISGVTATLDQLSLACDRLERILVARTRA